MYRRLLLIFVPLLLSACNTLFFNETYQNIDIHTPGVENAECTLETEKNKYVVLTPGKVTVDRKSKPLTLTCQKVGYYRAVEVLDSHYHMAPSQLNVFNGIVPGMVYDTASGSIYGYPERFVVNMIPNPGALVHLPPLPEQQKLKLKEEVVTPEDIKDAKIKDAEDAGDEELRQQLLDDEAVDRAMSKDLRK